ncbi:FURIN [Mytilus coruscus]|uniref:FURIN n=1 Tax=Mytilus coruscus TaxID=42192 RepID=A0A6J8EW10_MYTCO|nr:FURIN [Mytilus coruscus]
MKFPGYLRTFVRTALKLRLILEEKDEKGDKFRIGQEVYIKAQIRQTRTREKLSTLREDTDVNLLRRSPGIKWVQQEIGHVRVPKTVDTEWNNLWYLNDDVTPTMKVSSAWSAGYSGAGIVIAVLDDGLQTDHPDLAANVDTTNDIDIYDSDNNPFPPSGKSHGTQDNFEWIDFERSVKEIIIFCGVGVAFSSTLIDTVQPKRHNLFLLKGIRILGSFAISDSEEAQGLSHYLSNVDIYSNSWGPPDGTGFKGPGSLTKAALLDGVTNGRNGKGAIYIWSAGNGGTTDNCNGDGYVNSIYTVAISSATIGQNAWYSEVCAPALAVTYGGSVNDRYLTTITTESGCTSDGIEGTSYAAPLEYRNMLLFFNTEAKPTKFFRIYLTLISSLKLEDISTTNSLNDTYYSDWSVNGANKEFSQILGFGLMDADAMVSYGKIWITVPTQQTCTTSILSSSFGTTFPIIYTITVTSGDCPSINYLEHVVAHITFSYSSLRGVTQLYLISPSGTRSHLLHYRFQDAVDNTAAGSLTWDFMSVHFWKENLIGEWGLEISPNLTSVTVALDTWSLTFYGTTTDPWPEATTTAEIPTTKTTTDTITIEATTTAEIPITKTTTDTITKTTSNTKITSPNTVEPQDTPLTSPVTPVIPETNTMNTTNIISNVGTRSASDNTAMIAGTCAAIVVSVVTFLVLRKVCCGTAARNPVVHPSI